MPAPEFVAFKADIKERGQLVPITVNDHGVILDGHHRFRACQELGINCEFIEKNFHDELLEKLFVIDVNENRRHLNKFQRAELALKKKPILEELARKNREANLKQNSVNSKGPSVRNLTVGRVDDQIGKKAGISRDTIWKVETILERAPEGLKEKLESGKITINKAFKKIRNEERRQEIITKASSSAIIANSNQRFLLINNDFRQVKQIKENSVDLIFTDPPYEGNYISIYDDLANLAKRTLVQNGSIVMYLRQYDIPTIIRYMEGAGLTYHWLLVIKLAGPFPRAHDKGVVIKQKPLLWFTKGKRKATAYDYLDDLIDSSSPHENKNLHQWAQSSTEAEQIISKLTVENQTVLDPMMGSGTTGIAALQLKRKFIGIENDPKYFEIAKAKFELCSFLYVVVNEIVSCTPGTYDEPYRPRTLFVTVTV